MTRRTPNMTEKLAAALLELDRWRATAPADLAERRVVGYEEAKMLTPKQIIARWSWDHYPVRFVDREVVTARGIPYIHHPANLTPRPHSEHGYKTAAVDIPQNAKRKRIVRKRAASKEHQKATGGAARR